MADVADEKRLRAGAQTIISDRVLGINESLDVPGLVDPAVIAKLDRDTAKVITSRGDANTPPMRTFTEVTSDADIAAVMSKAGITNLEGRKIYRREAPAQPLTGKGGAKTTLQSTEYVISFDPDSPGRTASPKAVVRDQTITDSKGTVIGTSTIAARDDANGRHITATASSGAKKMGTDIDIKQHDVTHAILPVPDSIKVRTSKSIGETPLSSEKKDFDTQGLREAGKEQEARKSGSPQASLEATPKGVERAMAQALNLDEQTTELTANLPRLAALTKGKGGIGS